MKNFKIRPLEDPADFLALCKHHQDLMKALGFFRFEARYTGYRGPNTQEIKQICMVLHGYYYNDASRYGDRQELSVDMSWTTIYPGPPSKRKRARNSTSS